MVTLSYAAAGVAAPAAGTDNSATFFKALSDFIFASYNSDVGGILTTLANATDASTGSRLVLRAADASASFTSINSVPTIHQNGLVVSTPAGYDGTPFALLVNNVLKLSMGASGSLFAGGILSAGTGPTTLTDATGKILSAALNTVGAAQGGTGLATLPAEAVVIGKGTAAVGTVAPGTTGNILTSDGTHWTSAAPSAGHATTADALTAPVALTAALADYKALPSASAGQITIAAGGAYADSAGSSIGPLGQQTVTLPAQPSGTNSQWIAISLAPATGAPVVTAGTVASSSPVKPQFPAGNFAAAMVLWRGVTTLPSGIVALGDIIDHRNLGGGGGSGGGGTGGAPTTGQYWINGTNVALPNALNASDPTTNGIFNMALVGEPANLSLKQGLDKHLSRSVPGKISLPTTTSVKVSATSGSPTTIICNGKVRQITADVTVTISGAAGSRYIYADVSGTTGFTLVAFDDATNTPTADQMLMLSIGWDGSAIDANTTSYAGVLNGFSSEIRMQYLEVTNSASPEGPLTSTGGFTKPSGMNQVSFRLPLAQTVKFTTYGLVEPAVTGGAQAYVATLINGANIAQWATNIGGLHTAYREQYLTLAAGTYTLSQGVFTQSGASVILYERRSTVEFYR